MNEKNKHRLTIVLIVFSLLPILLAVPAPLDGSSGRTVLLYISSLLGYSGAMLLLWGLILGTRSIAGLFYNELTTKIKLHKWLGKYGSLLALAHPLFIVLGYAKQWTYTLVPNISTEYEMHVTFGRLAFLLLLIVWVSSALLRSKVAFRPWKYLHYLAYPVLGFTLIHVLNIGSSLSHSAAAIYWYSIVAISALCVVLRARHFFGYGKLSYQLIDKRKLTENVWMIKLHPLEKNLVIHTGQYVYFQINLFGEEHPFTVLDYSDTTGDIVLAYKEFGSFTKKIKDVSIGTRVYIDGPYGVFTKEITASSQDKSVFIAGGIGITPFVKHVMNAPLTSYLFYANQNMNTAVFRELLKNTLGSHFIDIFSRADSDKTIASPQPNIEYGYLTAEMIKKYVSEPLNYNYYICGPEGLMHASKEHLLSLGVPRNKIHLEEFGF